MQHADASPSSSNIWINCPASVTKARGKVRKSTVYTREGSAAHEIAEERLYIGVGFLYPDVWVIEGETITVTPEMCEVIELYARTVEDLKGQKHYEKRVQIDHGDEPLFGTADAYVIDPKMGRVDVVDLKYGQGVQVSPDSSQLKIYGLGVLNAIGPFEDIRTIGLTVVQPRANPEFPIRSADFPVSELETWATETLHPALDRISAGDQTETPGDHCRWCVRAGECEALASLAMSNARAAFPAIPPEPKTLDNDELGVLLDHVQMISDWIGKVRAEAMNRAEAGAYIPGWKMVAKRAVRRWQDPTGAFIELQSLGLDALAIMRIETIGNVETAMKRAKVPLTKLDAFTVKVSSGSTLVSEKDGRPAIDNSAHGAFSDVVET
jgi:hypothetical protein